MIISLERAYQAMELRKAGASYLAIGKQMDLSVEGARKCVMRAMADMRKKASEKAEDHILLQMHRLDQIILSMWKGMQKGDVASASLIKDVEKRRSELLGLDKPRASNVNLNVMSMADEVKKMFAAGESTTTQGTPNENDEANEEGEDQED